MTTLGKIQGSCHYYATKATSNARYYASVAKKEVYSFNSKHQPVTKAKKALFNTVSSIKNYVVSNKFEVGCMAACTATAFIAPKLLLPAALLFIAAGTRQSKIKEATSKIWEKLSFSKQN